MFDSGFFDSVNGDRAYSASQFSQLFDGLISDGIYSNIGNAYSVVPGIGLEVSVKSGLAWFDHTWNVNTSDLPLTLTISDLLLPRIDAVVLEVDTRVAVRRNRIFVKTGEVAVSPVRPSLTKADGLYQYALAYVSVAANSETIKTSDITSVIGTETPYVNAKLPINDVSDIYQTMEQRFQDWMDSLDELATDSAVVSLATSITNMTPVVNEIRPKMDDLLQILQAVQTADSIV